MSKIIYILFCVLAFSSVSKADDKLTLDELRRMAIREISDPLEDLFELKLAEWIELNKENPQFAKGIAEYDLRKANFDRAAETLRNKILALSWTQRLGNSLSYVSNMGYELLDEKPKSKVFWEYLGKTVDPEIYASWEQNIFSYSAAAAQLREAKISVGASANIDFSGVYRAREALEAMFNNDVNIPWDSAENIQKESALEISNILNQMALKRNTSLLEQTDAATKVRYAFARAVIATYKAKEKLAFIQQLQQMRKNMEDSIYNRPNPLRKVFGNKAVAIGGVTTLFLLSIYSLPNWHIVAPFSFTADTLLRIASIGSISLATGGIFREMVQQWNSIGGLLKDVEKVNDIRNRLEPNLNTLKSSLNLPEQITTASGRCRPKDFMEKVANALASSCHALGALTFFAGQGNLSSLPSQSKGSQTCSI